MLYYFLSSIIFPIVTFGIFFLCCSSFSGWPVRPCIFLLTFMCLNYCITKVCFMQHWAAFPHRGRGKRYGLTDSSLGLLILFIVQSWANPSLHGLFSLHSLFWKMPRNSKKAFIKLDRETLQNRKGAGWMSIYLQKVPEKNLFKLLEVLFGLVSYRLLPHFSWLSSSFKISWALVAFMEIQRSILLWVGLYRCNGVNLLFIHHQWETVPNKMKVTARVPGFLSFKIFLY